MSVLGCNVLAHDGLTAFSQDKVCRSVNIHSWNPVTAKRLKGFAQFSIAARNIIQRHKKIKVGS
jgi:hypothetical protein